MYETIEELEEAIKRQLNKDVDFSSLTFEEAELEYRKLMFPHRFQKRVTQFCIDCSYYEIILGNKVCLRSKSTECIDNDYKLKEVRQ